MSNEQVDRLAGFPVSLDEDVAREFELRLADSATLAFRVAFSVLRHHQDAEDVAQDAFVRAHRSFRRLRDRDRFRSWLVRTTWRLALDRRRGDRRRATRESVAPVAAEPPSTEEVLAARERSARLWEAIDMLPGKIRLVIVLAAIEEQSVESVGRLLDVPAGTVKSRLFEGRKRLQELLGCTNTTPTRSRA